MTGPGALKRLERRAARKRTGRLSAKVPVALRLQGGPSTDATAARPPCGVSGTMRGEHQVAALFWESGSGSGAAPARHRVKAADRFGFTSAGNC